MARGAIVPIDEKIAKAQEKVNNAQKRLDAAKKALQDLQNKKNDCKIDEIQDAIKKGKIKAEDIINFINNRTEA